MKNITGVDLNLLVAFDALMRERHVTRAAGHIGLAQPSMSNALTRLRALFDDELFVRTPQGMIPTEAAERIAPHVAAALEAAERAINDQATFDPAKAEFTIHLATTDYVEFVFLPSIMRRLNSQAPGALLRITPFDRKALGVSLDSAAIDLAIGVPGELAKRHMAQALFKESFVCISRKDHPGIRGDLDLATFVDLPHALASPRGDGIGVVDGALAEQGLSRRVVVSSASFIGLPFLIAESDLIAVTARRLAEQVAQHVEIDIHPVPVELTGFTLAMVWGKATDASPQHRWFRQFTDEIIARRE